MKAEVIVRFKDVKEEKIRDIGEVFELTKTRFTDINKKAEKSYGKSFLKEADKSAKVGKENCWG